MTGLGIRLQNAARKYGPALDVLSEYNFDGPIEHAQVFYDKHDDMVAWLVKVGGRQHFCYITRILDGDLTLTTKADLPEFEHAVDHILHWRAYLRYFSQEGWKQL